MTVNRRSIDRQRGDTTGLVIFAILVVLLLASLAGNAWLFHERDKYLEAKSTADQLNRDTKAAAEVCTGSVDRLAAAGKARDGRIERGLAAIAPQVRADQAASLEALKARPDDPKDLCGSALRFLQRSIKLEQGGP